MPTGLPPSDYLSSRKLKAFALDTSIIEAASFKFDSGALRLLSVQVPGWLQLVMPSIVEQEVFDHRAANVIRAEQQIKSGYAELRRHGGPYFKDSEPVVASDAIELAGEFFENQMDRFIEGFGGARIDNSMPGLAEMLFEYYFNSWPPFGGGKDKKHEFPDAAVLLSLENYAQTNNIYLIVVSKDEGWKAFAERSSFLYYLSSIESLTSLFINKSDEAIAVRKKIFEDIDGQNSILRQQIISAIKQNVFEIQWTTSTLKINGHSVDVTVTHVEFLRIEPKAEGMGFWLTSQNNDRCIAELVVEASIEATIEGSIRNNTTDVEVANGKSILQQNCELKVLLECSGELVRGRLDEWQVNIVVSDGKVFLNVGRSPFEQNRPELQISSNGQIFTFPIIGDSKFNLFDDEDLPF